MVVMNMKKSFILLLAISICSILMASPVYAKDKHVTDCLDNQEDCQELYDSSVDNKVNQKAADVDGSKVKSSSLFINIVKMIIALLFILVLIYALLWFIKRKNHLFPQAGVMENLGGITVGQQKSIQLVRIGDSIFIVGIGDNVELLQEIEDETLKKEILEQKESALQTPKLLQGIWKKKQMASENTFTTAFRNELTKIKINRSKLMQKAEKREDDHV